MAVLIKKPRSSSGHWYTREGKASHTQVGKNGVERSTDLRDARKLKLIPSVTTILNVFAKPGLDRWKLTEVAKVAQTLFKEKVEGLLLPGDNEVKSLIEGLDELLAEPPVQFADRCLLRQAQPVEKAADFGTEVHDAIEKYFEGEPVPDHLLEYIRPAFEWKQEKQLTFVEREKILVSVEHGYAGMVDIICLGPDGQKGVIDWKTRKTKKDVKVRPYDFQVHQIAAYAVAHWGSEAVARGEVFGANCYISSTEPGRFDKWAYSPAELAEAWEVFQGACAIWRAIKNYDPRRQLR